MARLRKKGSPRPSRRWGGIRVRWLAAYIMAVATPHLSADITLVSRLSDARAGAGILGFTNTPPAQTQTDFLLAQLSNAAMASGESGVASASSTSNSSIVVNNATGSLQVLGNGTANCSARSADANSFGSAKIIVLSFTLTDVSYAYSLTGQLSGSGSLPGGGTARLTTGVTTIFEVNGGGFGGPPSVTLSQAGTLPPGTYTLSVNIGAGIDRGGNFSTTFSGSSADFDFVLSASPTPSPTPTPTPIPESVFLPIGTINTSVGTGTTVSQPVTVTDTDPARHYIALSFDLTFDETVVSFSGTGGVAIAPQAAGLTAATQDAQAWSFSANVLAGAGPIRTLRIFANQPDGDTPLSGSGLLFNLRMRRVSSTPGAVSPLVWAAAPNNFQLFSPSGVSSSIPANGSITIQSSTNSIAGTVTYCTHPTLPSISGVTMTLSGTSSGVLPTDGSGNYSFTGLTSGGNYTVVPTKAALEPGVDGIDGADVVKVLQHVLQSVIIPPGCALTAADADSQAAGVDGGDIVAILRFYLGFPNAPNSRCGQYLFTPLNRAYSPLVSDQSAQNYSAVIYGDVTGSAVDNTGWIHRAEGGPTQDAATVTLPDMASDRSMSNLTTAVTTTVIDPTNKLVGFQGDITFDERVVTFDGSRPVRAAGLTAGNWNVSGHVLPGAGPIRTLRLLGYSNDFAPLSGSGTLFELRMTRVSKTAESAQLTWAAAPHGFLFIDADSRMQPPGNTAPGSTSRSP